MNEESQELDGEATTRWLEERHHTLLAEMTEVLDVEAGLTSIISDSPDAS